MSAAEKAWCYRAALGEGAHRGCPQAGAESTEQDLSQAWGNCWVWGWGCSEGSKHGMCGKRTIRQVLKAELAFVWWFEMESGTPRDKSKIFCIWQTTLRCTNNISLWIGAEGGLWDVIMVSSNPLPFLVQLSALVTPQSIPRCRNSEVTLITRMKFTLVQHQVEFETFLHRPELNPGGITTSQVMPNFFDFFHTTQFF